MTTVNPHLLSADDFELHVSDADSLYGCQWGEVVLQLAVGARDEGRVLKDPEAIRCHETGYSPSDIYLGKRQYTDVALGMLDGPVRDNPKGYLDQFQWTARTPKGSLTRRQRRKLRKAKRAAKRNGLIFNEDEFIKVELIRC